MRPTTPQTVGGGRYRLERRLGAGGMASVWLARDDRLKRLVAVKLVADTLAGDEHWMRRFPREARAAAGVAHHGVVSVFDYGVEDGRPFLVMEYVAGGNLAERLKDPSGPLDTATVSRELLDALRAVHAAGIVHRDVKPANVLLDEHDHVRLTDFGIAQDADATALTQTGMVVGTLRYLAPEVAAGERATPVSDLYSAGMVIRELAGDKPEPALVPLVAALTAARPGDRPRSAEQAIALLDGGGGDAPGVTAATRTQPKTAPTRVQGTQTAATKATRATAAAADTTAATVRRGLAPVSAGLRRNGIPPALAYVAGALLVVIVIVVLASSGGSGSGSSATASRPAPARASAPLSQQLGALNRIVDAATAGH